MTAEAYRPPRCQDCKIAELPGVLRNCPGPIKESIQATEINEAMSITPDGRIIRTKDAILGRVVCRNPRLVDAIAAVDEMYFEADERVRQIQEQQSEDLTRFDTQG